MATVVFAVDPTLTHSYTTTADANDGRRPGLTSSEREELARLRKENRVLREERDILKRATAFIARGDR